MQPIIRSWAQTSRMDPHLSEYSDHGSTICASQQKQLGHIIAHIFSRLTRPMVTANMRFMGYKLLRCLLTVVVQAFCPNSLPSFADFAAPRNTTVMMS
jgi:hypothetical protein